MSLRHFFHELRRVARESFLPALVPTAVVLFCLGVWHFLWLAREPDPTQAAELTQSHRQILTFFDDWWPYLGWVFPFLIVKRLDTEDPTGMQRTLPLTRRELLGAKLAFTVLATVALPTAAFAAYQSIIHPENWLAQAGIVAATQTLLACVGAGAALIAPGVRGVAWMVGAYVIFQYVSGATGSILDTISGPVASPVFEGTPGAFAADACSAGVKYASLLLAPLAIAWLASGTRRIRPAIWLLLAVPLGILTALAQRTVKAPRFAKIEASEQATSTPLSPKEAKAVAKEPWVKVLNAYDAGSSAPPVAKAHITLNAPGLVPGTTGPLDTLSGFARMGNRVEATKVAAQIATRVDTESFWPRSLSRKFNALGRNDHNDRIARLIATGAFPRDVRFLRLGATPNDNSWQTVPPSPDEVRLDLTITAPPTRGSADGNAPESVTVEVPFTRFASPEILLRTPARERAILRERDLVVTLPPVFYAERALPRTDIGLVYRAGPFGAKRWEQGEDSVQYTVVMFNPVKKQAVILPAINLAGTANFLATPATSLLIKDSPQVDEAWLKESEQLVIRLRALETVKRLVEIRPAAAAPVEQI